MVIPRFKTILLASSDTITIHPHLSSSIIETHLVVEPLKTIKLWGKVTDQEGLPIKDAYVELVQIITSTPELKYKTILSTSTDYDGYYQFEVSPELRECYRILVTKSQLTTTLSPKEDES